MIQPFGLRHALLVQRLQRSTERLDMVHALIRPRNPLLVAVLAPFPWRGAGVATYVLQGRRTSGMAQVLKRPGRPESDVLSIAPALRLEQAHTTDIWLQLLSRCAAGAAQHGVQRIFASVPLDGAEEEVMRQVGFIPYTRETIYRLQDYRLPPVQAHDLIRPWQDRDAWSMQRLYHAVTPPVVQQAEGALESESSGFPPVWWESPLLRSQGHVMVRGDDLIAGAQMQSGSAGHWLRIWCTDEGRGGLAHLIDYCLVALGRPKKDKPVYCAIRDYQGGMRFPLLEHGFQPYLQRMRLVKHLAVRIKEPALAPAAALATGGLPMSLMVPPAREGGSREASDPLPLVQRTDPRDTDRRVVVDDSTVASLRLGDIRLNERLQLN